MSFPFILCILLPEILFLFDIGLKGVDDGYLSLQLQRNIISIRRYHRVVPTLMIRTNHPDLINPYRNKNLLGYSDSLTNVCTKTGIFY